MKVKNRYLYGASVQGIQNFIFQTNELRDIIGASELVEDICNEKFNQFIGESDEMILKAAGNIKCIFSDMSRCEKAVLQFPKLVQQFAPGVTISQAVVPYSDTDEFAACVDKLESRLRAQRNRPDRSQTLGMMGIKRSQSTGLPVIQVVETKRGVEYLDAGTKAKLYNEDKRKGSTSKLCEKCFGHHLNDWQIAYDIEKMTDANDWIAVIHADGNGLGQVVQKVGKNKDDFKEFSESLNEATQQASRRAFEHIASSYHVRNKFVLRPVVLGGDDLTVICRGDIAIDYTSHFLRYFEEETELHLSRLLEEHKVFGINHLTACAGIAFIKSSYPFYYGYNLAEALCEESKKEAKSDPFKTVNDGLAPSCLMFHKVQDSFVESFSDIEARELTPCEGVSWKFGPYYINDEIAYTMGRWTPDKLLEKVEREFSDKEGNAIKSHLRQWMSLMHKNPDAALQKKERMIAIAPEKQKIFVRETALKPDKRGLLPTDTYPVYDLLAIHSIIYKSTKKRGQK